MSVVFHRSTGKMILKGFVAAIILSFAWTKSVTGGTSYSNVYVQSGPGLAVYGPAALRNAPLAPLSTAPLISNSLPPCVSPCVVPSQQVAALTPVATSSANFVTYKSPIRVPVVVAPSNDDGTSYEYSYVVYDEDTGDQKAQKETSDGSTVRGQYSLIQPDGYIREVQYTADDIRGFNAVVKNFLPEEEAKAISPCPEVKSEPLKEAKEKIDETHDLEPEAHGEKQKHESESSEANQAPEESPAPIVPKLQENEQDKHDSHEDLAQPEKNEDHGGQELHESKDEPKSPALGNHEDHGESQGPEQVANGDHASPDERAKLESQDKSHSTNAQNKEEEPRATQVADVLPITTDALVSYNDVIKCIQSAINRANTAQPSALPSPLTYIILNKPC